jgi:hypothetical protein
MDFIEVNGKDKTIRKFGGCDNKKEATDHVLSFNQIFVFDLKIIEDTKETIDQFIEDLGISDYKKIGKFKRE